MQEANWNLFKAKFNGKEQRAFEWLCSILFCEEFNQQYGLFRYKNQAGIEADPIEVNNQWVGFQAKFYETKLSENKNDIKDSIKKAKQKNPHLNKIIFYINQEFSESSSSSKKEPTYKQELEKFALSHALEIIWKIKSFFESIFVCKEQVDIARHFFSDSDSVFDLIEHLNNHTQILLDSVRSEISSKSIGSIIKINRNFI